MREVFHDDIIELPLALKQIFQVFALGARPHRTANLEAFAEELAGGMAAFSISDIPDGGERQR